MAYVEKEKKEELVGHLTSAVVCLRVINQQEKKDDDTPAPHEALESTLTNAIGNLNVDIAELEKGVKGETGA